MKNLSITLLLLACLGGALPTWAQATQELCDFCPGIPEKPPEGWSSKECPECVDWVVFRARFNRSAGHATNWADYFKPCQENDTQDCLKPVPERGTILITRAGQNEAEEYGHVAVVECVGPGAQPDWVRVSEYNWTPCKYRTRCVDLKKARELGTPYLFLYPEGKPVDLPIEGSCVGPIAVQYALVTTADSAGSSGTVRIRMQGPYCDRIQYRLRRQIYVPTVNGYQLSTTPGHNTETRISNIYAELQEPFSNVPPCSRFEYTLVRGTLTDSGSVVVDESPPRLAVNLREPPGLHIETAESMGSVRMRWAPSCPTYPGGAVRYLLEVESDRVDGSLKQYGPVSGTEYKVPDLLYLATTYTFRIQAWHDYDVSTKRTQAFTTPGHKLPIPQKPTLSLTGSCPGTGAQARWAKSTSADYPDLYYVVQVTRPDGTTFEGQGTVDIQEVRYSWVPDQDGTYEVRVQTAARVRNPDGTYSIEKSAFTEAAKLDRDCFPEAPTEVKAVSDPCKGVNVSWSLPPAATVANLKQFELQRVGPNGPEPVGAVPAAARTFLDTQAMSGVKYLYGVRALYTTSGASGFIHDLRGPQIADVPPRAPELRSIRAEGNRIWLRFVDRSTTEERFDIHKSVTSPNWFGKSGEHLAASGTGRELEYSEANLAPDLRYYFKVLAFQSRCQADASMSTGLFVPVLVQPKEVTAVQTNEVPPRAEVSWKDGNQHETAFNIFRKGLADTSWPAQPIATVVSEVSPWARVSWRDPGPLSPSGYQYMVQAVFSGGSGTSQSHGPQSEPVTYIPSVPVCASPSLTPPVLSRVQNHVDPNLAELTISYSPASETGFRVEYLVEKTTEWKTLQDFGRSSLTFQVPVGHLLDKRFSLRVRALRSTLKSVTCHSEPSNALETTVLPVPSQLRADLPDAYCRGLRFEWEDNSAHDTQFEVQYMDATEPPDRWAPLGITNRDTELWCHHPAIYNRLYKYRVRALFKMGEQLVSASSWAIMPTPVLLPPMLAAPQCLNAQAMTAHRIRLNWTDSSSAEDGFSVEYRPTNGNWVHYANTNPGETALAVKDLNVDSEYDLRVRAFNAQGTSYYCESVKARTLPLPPLPPSGVTVKPELRTIDVSWTDNSNNEDGFRVEWKRCGSNTGWSASNFGPNTTTYKVLNLEEGACYRLRVAAYNRNSPSFSSDVETATRLPEPFVVVADAKDPFSAVLKWESQPSRETGFKFQQRAPNGNWEATLPAEKDASSRRVTVTGLQPNTDYHFRVKAFNAEAGSPWTGSNGIKTLLPPPPGTPSELTATVVNATTVRLTWRDNANNETGYTLQWRKCAPERFGNDTPVFPNATSWDVAGLRPGSCNVFRLKAYHPWGNSDWSNHAQATLPPPKTPVIHSAKAGPGCGVVKVWWYPAEGATGYEVHRSKSANTGYGSPVPFGTTTVDPGTGLSYGVLTGLDSGAYYFKVLAVNDAGKSALSSKYVSAYIPCGG